MLKRDLSNYQDSKSRKDQRFGISLVFWNIHGCGGKGKVWANSAVGLTALTGSEAMVHCVYSQY